ncbi:MAG: metal ABC transporter permease [Phycisphaerae bacterium]
MIATLFDPEQLARTLRLADHGTRVILLAVGLLGLVGGVVGCFVLLRKRSLLGDALSHATLPGLCLAFAASLAWGGTGKSLPVLLVGATLTGLAGVGCLLAVRHFTHLKEDVGLAIVLAGFFGLGAAMLPIVSRLPGGSAAGLERFIYGKTTSIVLADAWLIAAVAAACLLLILLFYKPLKLLCFDEAFAASLGWAVLWLDVLLMGLVTLVTIVALQAVGLILAIAILIIPAASARFWTDKLPVMLAVAAGLGAVSAGAGAAFSASAAARMPAGAVIVLAASVVFFVSMLLGSQRGILVRRRRVRLAFEPAAVEVSSSAGGVS